MTFDPREYLLSAGDCVTRADHARSASRRSQDFVVKNQFEQIARCYDALSVHYRGLADKAGRDNLR